MLTIHKYTFEIQNQVKISLPKHSKILKFDNQNEVPTIWVLVDTEQPLEEAIFTVRGTGHSIPRFSNLEYIGSAQFLNGQLVWHLFKEQTS